MNAQGPGASAGANADAGGDGSINPLAMFGGNGKSGAGLDPFSMMGGLGFPNPMSSAARGATGALEATPFNVPNMNLGGQVPGRANAGRANGGRRGRRGNRPQNRRQGSGRTAPGRRTRRRHGRPGRGTNQQQNAAVPAQTTADAQISQAPAPALAG